MVDLKAPLKLVKLDLELERDKSAKGKPEDTGTKGVPSTTRPQKQSPSKVDHDAVTKVVSSATRPPKLSPPKQSPSKIAVSTAWSSFRQVVEKENESNFKENDTQPKEKKKKKIIATTETDRKSKANRTKSRKSTAKASSVEFNFLDASKPTLEATSESPRSIIEHEHEAPKTIKGLYSPYIRTYACETLCHELGLTTSDIKKIKRKFDDNDMYHTGQITQAEFFFMINEDRRLLTKGIFKLGTISVEQKFISFDEYVVCVATFASMTPGELFQFIFDVFDDDQSGSLNEHEFAEMSRELQSKQFSFPKNVEHAIHMIEGKEPTGIKHKHLHGKKNIVNSDGLVDFDNFQKFARLFPVAFFPIFNFQKNVRINTLSVSKWSKVVARKLRIQELVRHMRKNKGEIPELTMSEWFFSIFDGDIIEVRKRASELYGLQNAHKQQTEHQAEQEAE